MHNVMIGFGNNFYIFRSHSRDISDKLGWFLLVALPNR